MPSKVEPTAKFHKKWLIKPGYVQIPGESRKTYVPATTLMKLYGVKPIECVVERDDYMPLPGRRAPGLEGLTVLAPRPDGKYKREDGSPNA